jgi:glutamine synthetase
VVSGSALTVDGIATDADPGPTSDAPYRTDAPRLPQTLMVAIAALRDNACFRAAFGDGFIDYFVRLKEFEINRFLSAVTDWEQREYFALL